MITVLSRVVFVACLMSSVSTEMYDEHDGDGDHDGGPLYYNYIEPSGHGEGGHGEGGHHEKIKQEGGDHNENRIYREQGKGEPLPYKFGYTIRDQKHGSDHYREESSDGASSVKGSYGYTDPKGLYRHVEYVADKSGFRAIVRTNEPGTDKQHPADVTIMKSK